MNHPTEKPTRPGRQLDQETREELERRLETYERDKATAVPAQEFLERLLKKPADEPKP